MQILLARAACVLLTVTAVFSLATASANDASPSAPSDSAPAVERGVPVTLFFGDVDADGLEDALSIDALGDVRLLSNIGAGGFEDITPASGLSALEGASCAVFADFDGDGDVDLFAGSSEHRLWRNLGNASFEPVDSGIEHDLIDFAASSPLKK